MTRRAPNKPTWTQEEIAEMVKEKREFGDSRSLVKREMERGGECVRRGRELGATKSGARRRVERGGERLWRKRAARALSSSGWISSEF